MAKANSTAAPANAQTALSTAGTNFSARQLSARTIRRFDANRMAKHDLLLAEAGQKLSFAYEVSRVVSHLSDILRADQNNADKDEDVLSPHAQDALLSAIFMLSEHLHATLCHAADKFDRQLDKAESARMKGGA